MKHDTTQEQMVHNAHIKSKFTLLGIWTDSGSNLYCIA